MDGIDEREVTGLPAPRFVGFMVKRTEVGGDPWSGPGVDEICSVSHCRSAPPEDWIDHWKHNELGFYDSEAVALEVAGGVEAGFDLYAYRLYPLAWDEEGVEALPIEARPGELPPEYERLGYDVVTRSMSDFFDCSPLSCNAGWKQYPVNRYCLIDELEAALRAVAEMSRGQGYEPGPYHLFEVYRKRRPAS